MKNIIRKILLVSILVIGVLALSACSKEEDGTPKALEMNNSDTGLEIIMRDFSDESSVTQDYAAGDFLYISCEGGVSGEVTLSIRKGEEEPIFARSEYQGEYMEDIIEIYESGSYEVKVVGEKASGRIYITTDPNSHIETIEDFVDEDLPD